MVHPAGAVTSYGSSRIGTWSFVVMLAFASLFCLFAVSFAGAPWILLVPAALLMLATAAWWLALFIISPRARSKAVIAAPVVVGFVIVSVVLNLPVKARFAVSEPAFQAVVQAAGPPEVQPVDPSDEEAGWVDFPGPCPGRLGLFWIRDCAAFPGGYLFYDVLGTGLVDDAGFAYLPAGVPADAGTGWFESPEFFRLQGDWYVFFSSW